MKKLLLALAIVISVSSAGHTSLTARHWPASDKAKKFIIDTIVIGMPASPYGTGVTVIKTWPRYTAATRCASINRSGKAHPQASGMRNIRNTSNCVGNLWRNTVLVKYA